MNISVKRLCNSNDVLTLRFRFKVRLVCFKLGPRVYIHLWLKPFEAWFFPNPYIFILPWISCGFFFFFKSEDTWRCRLKCFILVGKHSKNTKQKCVQPVSTLYVFQVLVACVNDKWVQCPLQPVTPLFQGQLYIKKLHAGEEFCPVSDSSTLTIKGWEGTRCFMGAVVNTPLSWVSTRLVVVFHCSFLGSFLRRSLRGAARELKPWINLWQNLPSPFAKF